ncbi:hypothetical protein PoB_006138400 [Plakobranchus ocellatus]|uniref:Uncharacterized protein n=1 Tax=Plakobranchus ocellatus TaxID=259542 RepID=A0AAV4CSK6_9GAST|nr:hypothetical protein PoB_006138400 [Plakobranchus ocellatus]
MTYPLDPALTLESTCILGVHDTSSRHSSNIGKYMTHPLEPALTLESTCILGVQDTSSRPSSNIGKYMQSGSA